MTEHAISALVQRCGTDWISTRWIDRLVMARDASLYRLVPQAVARPRSIDDVRLLISECRKAGLHLTFRAAGTSLSGQAVTDGILVDLSRHWKGIQILEQGAQVRVQPGITGGRVNAHLAPYGRKLGPDPASLNAAMIGGIVANNASGMCCGTAQNTYHTMASIRFMLSDGTVIDTADEACDANLQTSRPDLHAALTAMRDEIRSDDDLVERIRGKYRIKNTMGYSLNAFLDEEQPARILGRLMVGSEGTLGFIEQVVYNTVDDPRDKHTALFVYDSIDEACATVDHWRSAGAAAVEIMDDASIRSFSSLPHTPERYRVYQPGRAALLVEFHGEPPSSPGEWVTDAEQRAQLWKLRKGLMPTVGALRPTGSTMINEDIAVPPDRLAALVHDVQGAFAEHGFTDAIIFGHAKDGNIHFVINQDFAQPGEVERYRRFMDRIAEIVVDRHGGSLKAEHGTGRNMAPYVEQEWGRTAFALMRRLKELCDPEGILNPDVLVSADPEIHLKHIKPVPTIEESVNACIECGFCEHVCPTRAVTLTPRQRIALQRELQEDLPDAVRKAVLRDAAFDVDASCAADGMCATACPVDINTADLVKSHRTEQAGAVVRTAASLAARHPLVLDAAARLGSTTARFLPAWPKPLGRPDTTPGIRAETPQVIFAPACPSRWFGTDGGGQALSDHVRTLSHLAGIAVHQVDSGSVCCGQIFDSKGLATARDEILLTSRQTLEAVPNPSIPMVTDVSTCGAAFAAHAGDLGRTVLTPLTFLEEWILPRVTIRHRFGHVIVHPGCGVESSGDHARLLRVVSAVSERITIPPSAGCCGMAGDHGLRHPELVDAALHAELDELKGLGEADAYVSLNPVCQAALADRSEREWTSVWALVAAALGTRHQALGTGHQAQPTYGRNT